MIRIVSYDYHEALEYDTNKGLIKIEFDYKDRRVYYQNKRIEWNDWIVDSRI
jgi:hypothetical protein